MDTSVKPLELAALSSSDMEAWLSGVPQLLQASPAARPAWAALPPPQTLLAPRLVGPGRPLPAQAPFPPAPMGPGAAQQATPPPAVQGSVKTPAAAGDPIPPMLNTPIYPSPPVAEGGTPQST